MDPNSHPKRPPQMKVNGQWITLTHAFVKGVQGYLTADAVRDALVLAKRIRFNYESFLF